MSFCSLKTITALLGLKKGVCCKDSLLVDLGVVLQRDSLCFFALASMVSGLPS